MGPAAPLGARQATDGSGLGTGPAGRAPGAARQAQRGAPGALLAGLHAPLNWRSRPDFAAGLALGCGLSVLVLLLASGPGASRLLPAHARAGEAGGQDGGAAAPGAGPGSSSVFPPSSWDAAARASRARALIRHVERHAPADIRARCAAIIRGDPGSVALSFSQAAQDWLLFHNYFFHIPYGQGTYLDIGSNHPLKLSNTYFFDKCLGWRGVCVEPNPEYHPLYAELNRTCALVKACLADRGGARSMNLRKGVLGRLGAGGAAVVCQTLAGLVEEHGLGGAELASLDIEGAELATLRCFPFRAHRISTWLVETDKAGRGLFALFLRNGYAHVQDILCPMRRLHSDRTRVGVALDSVFRLVAPGPVLGPPFLPGRSLQGLGPRGPCAAWSRGDQGCPEQVPVVDIGEVHEANMTLREGACPATGAGPDAVLPTSEHPSIFRA